MPRWVPDNAWADSDVYVIGGGPSLSGFDFELLRDKYTIGCNAAFRLGAELCNVCFFSDQKWFWKFKEELAEFPGLVLTHCVPLHRTVGMIPWLYTAAREKRGLHRHAIGFGWNSGCGAVNVALQRGARRVFLLGFDCKLPADLQKTHWHDWRINTPNPVAYRNFMEGWELVADALPLVFPGTEIINLNPDSAIPFFPKAHYSAYLHGTYNARTG